MAAVSSDWLYRGPSNLPLKKPMPSTAVKNPLQISQVFYPTGVCICRCQKTESLPAPALPCLSLGSAPAASPGLCGCMSARRQLRPLCPTIVYILGASPSSCVPPSHWPDPCHWPPLPCAHLLGDPVATGVHADSQGPQAASVPAVGPGLCC